jgi:ubiquinone/menaquinone biosynthesis C-methylase UbiE
MAGNDAGSRYIPALRFDRLTALYDPVVALTTRERGVKGRVLERAAVRDGESVLDLACGTGTLAIQVKQARPGASVQGLDGDPAILERARAKAEKAGAAVEFVEGLSTELPYEADSFDVALSTLFFHHLADEDKRRSASELSRVLRPGGRVVVADWGRPQDPLMRLAFLPVQLLDGFETTSAGVAGELPRLLEEGGLDAVHVTDRLRTPNGTMELLSARRAA